MPNLTAQWVTHPLQLPGKTTDLAPRTLTQVWTWRNWIYVAGGTDGTTVFSDVWRIRVGGDGTLQGNWVSAGNLPVVLASAGVVVHDNKVYLVGGQNQTVNVADVWIGTLTEDGTIVRWANHPMPLAATSIGFGCVLASNGFMYVAGGINGTVLGKVMYAKIGHDGSMGAWKTQVINYPDALQAFASVQEYNGHLFIVGGGSSTVSPTRQALSCRLNADGSVQDVKQVGHLLVGRYRHAVLTAQGFLWFFGGSSTQTAATSQGTVELLKLEVGGLGLNPHPIVAPSLPKVGRDFRVVLTHGVIYLLSFANGTASQPDIFSLSIKY